MAQSIIAVDKARAAFPILVNLAQKLSKSNKEKQSGQWATHDDLVKLLKDAGIKENSRSVVSKILKPIQVACIDAGLPDLSAIIIKRPKGDQGDLIAPSPAWWEPYVEKGYCQDGSVPFWFAEYKRARDFHEWPDQLPTI